MLRAAVVERDKEKRALMRAGISGLNIEISVTEFSNEYDFSENLGDDASAFDIIVFNTTIHKEGDGVSLAAEVRRKNRKVMICFATDSNKYYAEAFSVFATGYLIYPFDMSALHNCISFYYQQGEPERRASWMIKETGGSYRRIYTRYITYIESSNREVIIHLEDGSTISCYNKLDNAANEICSKQFLRCHQSYIVNLYFVDAFDRGSFHLQGTDIPVSRKFQKAVKEAYYDYMFDKM